MEPTAEQAIASAASDLLAAMDRQHGTAPFSLNVETARRALTRQLHAAGVFRMTDRDERDRADRAAA